MSKPQDRAGGLELTCLRLGTGVGDAVNVGDAAVDLQCADAARTSVRPWLLERHYSGGGTHRSATIRRRRPRKAATDSVITSSRQAG